MVGLFIGFIIPNNVFFMCGLPVWAKKWAKLAKSIPMVVKITLKEGYFSFAQNNVGLAYLQVTMA